MDFEHSPRVKQLQKELSDFMQEHVLPNEHLFKQQTALNRWSQPPILKALKARARATTCRLRIETVAGCRPRRIRSVGCTQSTGQKFGGERGQG